MLINEHMFIVTKLENHLDVLRALIEKTENLIDIVDSFLEESVKDLEGERNE